MNLKIGPILTKADRSRLEDMTQSLRKQWGPYGGYVSELEQRMQRANVVPVPGVSSDVVTMNSRVRVRDLQTGKVEMFTLVYQSDSDGADGAVSVLTPLGSALLGARVGDVIDWTFRHGARRLEIERVLYQPEAAGDFDL